MELKEEDYLVHYGILRKSGRYPGGSGNTQNTRNKMFLDTVEELRQKGMSDVEIAKSFSREDRKFTTHDLRALSSIAINQQRQDKINQAQRLKEKGLSNVAIGEKMDLNESSVRSLLAPGAKDKADILQNTAEMLRRQVDEKGAIDIGAQTHHDLPLSDNAGASIGISSTKFNTAVAMLREQGYAVHTVKVKQLSTGLMTDVKVLARRDVKWKDLVNDPQRIKSITEHTKDGGKNFIKPKPPKNLDAKRVKIVYDEDGGSKKDGLIELRPGVKDLDMGGSRYAQVRIAVNGTHYLKGMAVYNKDLPKGVDVQFNTNKSKKEAPNKTDAMKKMEIDKLTGKVNKLEPFGAEIRRQSGMLNIVNEQGKWDDYKRRLPSQFLAKQDPKLAKTQLDLTHERRKNELESILALTNPTVRKKLLDTFADETDSSAVHLEAAARPKQSTKVLIPINSLKVRKDGFSEVYAPSLENGTRVALVRFPHGGTFEIPKGIVNNKNPEARRLLGTNFADAIGVNHKVADRLSGADFDGDTVLVIPNNKGEVKSTAALDGLKGFDPRTAYKAYPGMKPITEGHKEQQMGVVSNLITDMTIRGAKNEELARAVRHSMVIIDAHKHNLDYRSSAKDNGIKQLTEKYQEQPDGRKGGTSTLLSRATATTRIVERKPRPAADGGPIDKATGKRVYVETTKTYKDRDGNVRKPTREYERLAITDDAYDLVSGKGGTQIERVYADHSNRLKAMANTARKEMVNTPNMRVNKSAKQTYKSEVDSLNAKLKVAQKNAPLERQAQAVGRSIVQQKLASNPDMSRDRKKQVERRALKEARLRVGAKKHSVELTQREWDAIQAGAISNHRLEQILNNADLESVRKFATPKTAKLMSTAKTARANQMLAQGFTQAEVAQALGVALSTLKLAIE